MQWVPAGSGTLKTKLIFMKTEIGSLPLISYTEGFDWEVYDEDGEYQGMFCGNIETATEEQIWAGL